MNTIALIFLILFLGYCIGSIKIKGIGLGTSGIILVAIIFGHFGVTIPKEIQNFGLAIFVAAVGFIAGPAFFGNFKKKAASYLILGVVIILCGMLFCIVAIVLFDIPVSLGVGVMCGALTSTPGLAAAVEASGSDIATIGYGIAYPFGVVGVVLFVQLLPKLLKKRPMDEFEFQDQQRQFENCENAPNRVKVGAFGLPIFSFAVFLGVLLGSIAIPLPGGSSFGLGTAGGPLFIALLLGHFGHVGKLSLEVPQKTLEFLRELGLALFLLGAGTSAGNGFMSVLREYGVGLFLAGIVITLLPMILGFMLARHLFRLPLFSSLGCVCGGMTSTPALGTLISTAGTDMVAVSYAATYPIALISVVFAAQLVCLILG